MATSPRTVADGLGFAEGPTLAQAGIIVVVSLDQARVYGIGDDGAVAELIQTVGAPNGATEGPDGAIYLTHFSGAWPAAPTASGGGGVLRYRPAEGLTWLTRDTRAPNDLCFGPDGHLYVTDPTRGGRDGRLWRVDVTSGAATTLLTVEWYPNGIGFDAENRLWVADMSGHRLVRFGWSESGLGDPETVVAVGDGRPDGFAFDIDGNIVVAAATGADGRPVSSVQKWSPGGRLIATLLEDPSSHFTNVAIDGDATVYATDAGRGRLVAVEGGTPGLPLHPFRSTATSHREDEQ